MANIYKSNYTGAQVDDAIEKVLNAAPADGDELQKKLKEGNNITIATDGTISATNPTPSVTIAATATDDDVIVLTGSGGTNSVSYDAKHAKKGPASGYTSGNTTTSIGGSGGTIKIPQITVDNYGHVTAAADEDVTITMPDAGANYSVVELTNNQTTLTDEQYNTLAASPFNKIKRRTYIYDLQEENTTSLVYTTNYLNAVKRLTINKTTLQITKGELTLPTTHYTAKIVVGDNSNSTNNASTTNEHTYIKLVDGEIRRSYHKIQGGGATTVASDNSGNITITSTDAHVTSVDNHYTPTANSTSEISKDASSSTEATWGTTSLVTGVNIQRDAKGHVTGMTLDSIKMPAKPETSSSGVTSLGGKTGAITLGSGLSISSNNVLSASGGSTPTVSENVYTFSGSVGSGEDISLDTSVANLQDKQITGLWFHVGQPNNSSLISYNYQLSLADITMGCIINNSSAPTISKWAFNSGSQTLQFSIAGITQNYSNGTINYTFDIENIYIQGAASGSTPYVQFGFTYKGKDHAGSSMY